MNCDVNNSHLATSPLHLSDLTTAKHIGKCLQVLCPNNSLFKLTTAYASLLSGLECKLVFFTHNEFVPHITCYTLHCYINTQSNSLFSILFGHLFMYSTWPQRPSFLVFAWQHLGSFQLQSRVHTWQLNCDTHWHGNQIHRLSLTIRRPCDSRLEHQVLSP